MDLKPAPDKNSILAAVSINSFITPFLATGVNIALPAIGRQFGSGTVLLSWMVLSYLLVIPMFLVPFGRMGDLFGRRKVFFIGILIFFIGSLLCAIAGNATQFILFRIIQGIGAAMQFATGMAMLTAAFPPGERGRALGINIGIVYLGLSGGPFLGGLIVQYLGWRHLFTINAALGIILIVLVAKILKNDSSSAQGKFDFPGAALYSITVFLLMRGFSGVLSLDGKIMLLCGLLLGVAFVFFTRKSQFPLLNLGLFFRNQIFAFSGIAALINYSATYGVGFLLSLYLQYAKGIPASKAGIILVIQPLIQSIFSPITGRLSDKLEPRWLATVGMVVTASGLVMLGTIRLDSPMTLIYGSMALLGLGIALFSSPNTNAIMSSVEPKFFGVASGILSTLRLIGQTGSLAFVTMIFSVIMAGAPVSKQNTPDFLRSLRIDMVVFSILCLLGAGFSLIRGNMRKKTSTPVLEGA